MLSQILLFGSPLGLPLPYRGFHLYSANPTLGGDQDEYEAFLALDCSQNVVGHECCSSLKSVFFFILELFDLPS